MPITTSARKKMRQDKKRREVNAKTLSTLKTAVRKARKNPSLENLKVAMVVIDRAKKKGMIHQNKASRLKSRLAKKIKSEKPKPGK